MKKHHFLQSTDRFCSPKIPSEFLDERQTKFYRLLEFFLRHTYIPKKRLPKAFSCRSPFCTWHTRPVTTVTSSSTCMCVHVLCNKRGSLFDISVLGSRLTSPNKATVARWLIILSMFLLVYYVILSVPSIFLLRRLTATKPCKMNSCYEL